MLTAGGIDLRAVSVGGMETCIELPAYKLCFDIGRCPPTAVKQPRVLFTHAHCDHMGGVIHHCSLRDLHGMSVPEYYLPAENEAAFRDLLDAWRRLDRSDLPCTVHPVKPGDQIPLGRGKWAQAFRAVHRVPTIGYALGRTIRKLKAEYIGLPGKEIADRRRAGEDIHDVVEKIDVAFCGDTTIDVVERESVVRTATLLILEITFLDDRISPARSRKQGHVHIDDVVERAHLFENDAILFTHFSRRYSAEQVATILQDRLPPTLRERAQHLRPGPPWVL